MRFVLVVVLLHVAAVANAQNPDHAIRVFAEAIRSNPKDADAYFNRGLMWKIKGEHDKAIQDYTAVIQLNPQDPHAHYNRGKAWISKKEYGKAIDDYTATIMHNPRHVAAHNNLALLLATCPEAGYRDGRRAVESATTACKLTDWKNADWIATLAAAYAESGNFPEAIKRQQQALDLMPKVDREGHRSLLTLYKQGKPHRQN